MKTGFPVLGCAPAAWLSEVKMVHRGHLETGLVTGVEPVECISGRIMHLML